MSRGILTNGENAKAIRSAMEAKVEAGGYPGAAPLGYRNKRNPLGTTIETDEHVAPLIHLTYEVLGRKKMSLRSALYTMTKLGLRTKKGDVLSLSSFRRLVTNPLYAGLIRYKGQLFTGKHEALVSEQLFWQIQGQLKERQKRPV